MSRKQKTMRAPSMRAQLYYKKSLAKRVAKVEKQLKENTEMKYANTTYTGSILVGTPANLELSVVPQGVADNERVGNKIQIKSIDSRVYITSGPFTPSLKYRIIIYVCKKEAPSLDELLQGGTTIGYRTFRNNDFVSSYRVLYDKKFVMNMEPYYDSALVQFPPKTRFFHIYKKVNIPVSYIDGTLGTLGRENTIYMALFTDVGANGPSYDITNRIRYVDA